jgi:hypothetical protein
MQATVKELDQIVNQFFTKISAIPDDDFSAKPIPGKWSKKEVVGHLIDSAQNNLRRFIVGQYETIPSKIVYEQDFWVNVNGYQQMKREEIVLLWKLMNQRIAAVLSSMPETSYKKPALTSETHTLEWLAEDYVKHMKHHLNQVIPGSFNIIYK